MTRTGRRQILARNLMSRDSRPTFMLPAIIVLLVAICLLIISIKNFNRQTEASIDTRKPGTGRSIPVQDTMASYSTQIVRQSTPAEASQPRTQAPAQERKPSQFSKRSSSESRLVSRTTIASERSTAVVAGRTVTGFVSFKGDAPEEIDLPLDPSCAGAFKRE